MKGYTYISIILTFLFNLNINGQQNQTDSLITAALKMQDDTNKINALNDIVWKIKTTDIESAKSLGEQSIALAEGLNFKKGSAYANKNLGVVYYYQGDYDKAKELYDISLEAFKVIEDKKGIAIMLRNIGNIYDQEGNTKVALDYFLKSLALREEIGDKKGVAAVNAAIGLVYDKSDEKEQALGYFDKALKSYTDLNNQKGIAKMNFYLANTFYNKFQDNKDTDLPDSNSLNKAEHNLIEAQSIFEEINDTRYIASIYEMLGLVYMDKNLSKISLSYLNKSLELRIKMGNKFGMANGYINLGNYYKDKNVKKALKHYQKALDLSIEINANGTRRNAYSGLAVSYFQLKKTSKAYTNLLNFINLKDSLQNEDNTKKMTQLAMQYDFDKKEKLQEAEQQKKDAIQKERLKQQQMITSFFVVGFLLMLVLAFFIYKSYRTKQKTNILLEEKNQTLQRQKDKIAEQNKNITDSIKYAQRIQSALLPPNEFFQEKLIDYFIIYRPRDIVSGDFYWATEKHGKIILGAADCTGHGVPGAFMSMLGISFLNEIVNKYNPDEGKPMRANIVLNYLRHAVKTSLRQTGEDDEAKDGMDMALVIIDKENNKVQYAGAHNPLFLLRNGELIKYKADSMPVGIYIREKESFTNHEIDVQEGDTIYMFSDGYVDQFGGKNGKKYMISRLRKLILANYTKPMGEQKEIFETELDNWINYPNPTDEQYQQIDDILFIGFRI
ncbi:MAG: hypothetical protein B6I20_00615 [Bacteroidetes bacterium 4572_117]|nr:MAG: hypothetical protein B6I20_00615 [Bacteroidetes bacterium 4572_117]